MRFLLLLGAFHSSLYGQYTLYAAMANAKEYIVGAKLPPSGLFLKTASDWRHLGYNHPFISSLDYDSSDPSILYLAAGNGLIRASEHGEKWKFLTGSDVTELRDVAVDHNAPGVIYFGYCHGIRVSRDRGVTWRELAGGLHRKFTEALRVDRARAGVLLAGGEEGIFRSEDGGETWKIAGAAGFQITRLVQSPHAPCEWLAATQIGGLFASHDCGKTFENSGRIGVGGNLSDVAFDPRDPNRIAVAGWTVGLAISEDRGATWQSRNAGLPSPHVTSLAFDPAQSGRLYAGVNQEALYVSGDNGKSWSKDGLDGSVVTRIDFIPESAGK